MAQSKISFKAFASGVTMSINFWEENGFMLAHTEKRRGATTERFCRNRGTTLAPRPEKVKNAKATEME